MSVLTCAFDADEEIGGGGRKWLVYGRRRSLSVTARRGKEANLLKTCFVGCGKAGEGGTKIESLIWGNVGELYSPISGGRYLLGKEIKLYKIIFDISGTYA